ncbi:MAG: hypothetical protein FWD26_02120 [Treponema sp.]|nr:hypothetical protein [Treponema sp.]
MIEKINLQKNLSDNIKTVSGSKAVKIIKSNILASVPVKAAAAGDRLSSSIVSFARFFSLPLKQETLSLIRRQAFSAVSLPKGDDISKLRQALSLAAAAAESKGTELSVKGLEAYAQAIDPDLQKRRRQNREKNNQEEKNIQKDEDITAAELKKMANEYSGNVKLLDLLNKLPGKNGRRWIVLPFNFFDKDREYAVSMRILLENDNRAICMALDISIENEISKEKLLFIVETAAEKPMKVSVHFDKKGFKEAQFKKELAEALEIPPESVFVKTEPEEYFPCEAEQSSSIDEVM